MSRKSVVPSPVSAVSSPGPFGLFLSTAEITPHHAWALYKTCAPFAKIVDLIADNVASLVPVVQINGRPVDQHPAVAFMARPGFNRTRRRLIKEITAQYLVTGTAYVHVYGNPAMPPVAMDIIKSRWMTHVPGADAWPDAFQYSEGSRSIRFDRDSNPRDPRFIDSSSGFSEIVPVYDMDGDHRGIGLPRLNAIRGDVELRMKGLSHNSNLLDKGARLSGILSYKDPLDDMQQQAVAEQMRRYVGGHANAGSIMVTSGGEFDFQPTSQNAKDMDFVKLMESAEDSMVSRYNVPVTLFRTDAQTNNNYETAWNVLYDQAVLPAFDVVYSAISHVMSERIGEEILIVHDALTSPILARQASARARELFSAQLISRNEARELINYEPMLGGDSILGPMGMVPVAEDLFTPVDEALGKEILDSRRERLAIGAPKPTAKPGAGADADEKPVPAKERDRAPKAKDDGKGEKALADLSHIFKALSRIDMNGHDTQVH